MKNILVKFVIVVLLISSCSTQQLQIFAAPQANRLEVLKKSLTEKESTDIVLSQSEELAKAYLMGLLAEKSGDTRLACNLFNDLSENKELAINDAALVHSLINCKFSKRSLEKIWSKTNIPKYLKEAYLERSLTLAIENNLLKYEADFSYELIPFKPTQAEKVKLIKRSISILEGLKDDEKLKIYNDKLKEISPLNNPEINEKNIYVIAKDFEVNRNFEKARELYQQIINGNFSIEEKVKAYNAFRTSYKVARDLKSFLVKTFEMEEYLKNEFQKTPPDSNETKKLAEFWVESKITLARAVWTDHRNPEARKILDELISSNLGTDNQRATAQYIYGSLHLENKENREALKRFEKAASFKITDISTAENIQWATVWNSYLLKQDNKLVNYADQFAKKSINPNFIAKLNYWKAKALIRLKKVDEANEAFLAVRISDPFGYYGIISSIDLNLPQTPLMPALINSDATGNKVLDWLIAMDEMVFAQKYLKEIDSQFKTPQERERAMSLYAQTQWYQGGMRQIYNFKMSSRNAMTEKYINVVFPTPYTEIIDNLSRKYSVPKELIWAITRQESAFVPSERSWADAFGLMQIIPEKGAELARKYNIPYRDFNDLYNPAINLEMGTVLLKDLRLKFNYKFSQTVAAYNASESVIRVWERERFNGNYIEFIEMIPYEETRNYIKLVFRNYMIYKRITSKEDFMINKDFFAEAFN